MGYFLGKETLAVPSNEALNQGAGTAPAPPGSAGTPILSGVGGGDRDFGCRQECSDYRPDSPEFSRCMDECRKRGGKDCVAGKSCAGDADCSGGKCEGRVVDPVNKVVTPGKCNCSGTTGTSGTCPDGKGAPYAANPTACPCGTGWSTLTGNCGSGYTFIKRDDPTKWKTGIPYIEGAIGTCQCTQAISDWKAGQSGSLGEYQYPAGMQELMTMLLNRGKNVYGYDPKAIEAMFGRGFENVRGQEAGGRERLNRTLQSQGMLGTGTAIDANNELSFGTEKNINDLARDIMIKNEEQKRADTELSSSILGRGMGFEQLLEAINSGRRGESQSALSMLMALLQLFK